MQRRKFIRVTGGGMALAAASASTGCRQAMPAAAISPWQGPGDERDVRRWILGHAILAPHSHNLQSWRVDLDAPGEIVLRCDRDRLLPASDPYFRQTMMSHGTFVELLDIAARERGLRADITLFPEGEFHRDQIDARPVARVRLRPDAAVARDPLFARILERHTNRNAYDLTRPVPAAAWRAMKDAVQPDPMRQPLRLGWVGVDQPGLIAAHRALAAEAWRIELTTPRVVLETYKVLRVGAAEISKNRDGLYVLDPMVVLMDKVGLFDRTRAPAAGDYATTSQVKDFGTKLESTPGFLWMVTEGNDRRSQIAAGRAYARVQLAATAQGLAMQPIQQALQEYPEQAGPHAGIRQLLDEPQPGRTIQMWARVGYAPPVDPAPRRSLPAFIA